MTIAATILILWILWDVYQMISDYIIHKNSKNEPSDLSKMYEIERMVGRENSVDTDNR